MKIKCGNCEKEIDITSIWLCRRNNVDYCNSCITGKITEQLVKERDEHKETIKQLTTDLEDEIKGHSKIATDYFELKENTKAEHEIVENLKNLEYNVKKDGNEMYGIYCYNVTGGCEFSTHYGYADKEHAIREFQSVFHFDVWDYETQKTYKYDELQSILGEKV